MMTENERDLLISVARLLRAHLSDHENMGNHAAQDIHERLNGDLAMVDASCNPDNDHA